VAAFAYGTSMVRLLRFSTESVGVGGLPPALRAQLEPEGMLSTTWKTEFGEDVFAALPARSLRFSVSPEYVFSSLGVRAR
jgi:hypothetical protein